MNEFRKIDYIDASKVSECLQDLDERTAQNLKKIRICSYWIQSFCALTVIMQVINIIGMLLK